MEPASPQAETSTALPDLGQCWTITATTGHTVTGHLPTWAAKDPSETDVSIELLAARVSDLNHYTEFEGQTVRVETTEAMSRQAADEQLLFGSIDCYPYAEDPESRVPTASINITAACWISDLDPDGLAQFTAKLRAQADRLDHEVLPMLLAARAEWAAHHSPNPTL